MFPTERGAEPEVCTFIFLGIWLFLLKFFEDVTTSNVRVTMRYSGTSEARTSSNNVKSHSNVEKCESKAEEYEKEEDEEMVD